jgi:hypothetical protein
MDPNALPSPTLLVAVLLLTLLFATGRPAFVSPLVAILFRWLRWLTFAFGAAAICYDLEWIDRPLWALVAAFFLLWLLMETLRNWFAIEALSQSQHPLFPRYVANTSGEEWPTHPRLLRLRDWLRTHGFRPVQALHAEVGGGLRLRVSVYQDSPAAARVQVYFFPQPGGAVAVCLSVATHTASGLRYVTDNLCLPFGGFYPENCLLERRPLTRSLARLLARHRARLARAGETPVPWAEEPLADLNAQQRELERVNTELGFLVPAAEREEHGKITLAGRYRVWKECWLLGYLGRSTRYDE